MKIILKKTYFKYLTIELLLLGLLFSCSVEKRHYLSGYHIDWFGSKKNPNTYIKGTQKAYSLHIKENGFPVRKDSEVVARNSHDSNTHERRKNNSIKQSKNKNYSQKKIIHSNNINNDSSPGRIISEKEGKSGDGIFTVFAGIIGLLSFGIFKIGTGKVKNVSYWANNNKWKARVALTAIKLFLGGLGLYFGSILYNNDLVITNLTTNSLIGISLCVALLYPEKNKKHKFNTYSYTRQKTCDLILSMSGFMLMTNIGNQASASKDYFPLVSGFNQQIDKSVSFFSHAYNPRAEMMSNKTNSVNNEVNQMGVPKESDGRIIAKIFLTILALALFALLEFLILALSCNLTCNGSEVAAAIVGIGGTILNVLLLVAILKTIFKKYTKEVKTNETIPLRK